jgi:hypothetical protein
MCSDRHLTVLATYAVMHGLSGLPDDGASRSKQIRDLYVMLARENMASLDARYPGDTGDAIGRPVETAVFDAHSLPAVAIIKACHCYAYQACEHAGWETSHAKRVIDAIEARAVRHLPGYDAAPWGL